MKRVIRNVSFGLLLFAVPVLIAVYIAYLIFSKKILDDPIGRCVDLVLLISLWVITTKELMSRFLIKDKHDDSEFKVIDCMTIVLTISTICYSVIQICVPPLEFSQMLKLILWNTAIIVYTVFAKPTRARVLGLCLVATAVTALYVWPPVYQNYYESEISRILFDEYLWNTNEQVYRTEDGIMGGLHYENSNFKSSDDPFQELMEDEYFTKNFKNTLVKNIRNYNKCRGIETNTSLIPPTITVQFYNGTQVAWGDDLPLKVTSSSIKGDITRYNVSRLMLNGVDYDYKILGGDGCLEISLNNLRGFSGVKSITFLDGYAQDPEGNLSEQLSVSFTFYGYDIVILMAIELFALAFSTYSFIKHRKFFLRGTT